MKSLVLLLALLAVVACGKKKSESKINQFFVNGDPMKMLEGTSQNTKTFISDPDEFDGFVMSTMTAFIQKEEVKRESNDIESGQEATEEDETQEERKHYVMYHHSKTEFRY